MKGEPVRLYIDEDVDVLIATVLCSRGYDAVTTVESGNRGGADELQLRAATKSGRSIVTHNRVDFERLATELFERGESHAGIIIAQRRPPYEIVSRLLPVLATRNAAEMVDQLLYI